MNILYVIDKLGTGGKERRLTELLKVVSKLPGLSCRLILLKDVLQYNEVKTLGIPVDILKRRIKKDPFIFFKIWKITKEFKPDIIHSWGSMPSVYVFLIARLTGTKFVNAMITNGRRKWFSQDWFRSKITFPFSDAIVSNSYAGLYAYKVKKKGYVLYNGFNFQRTESMESPESVRSRFGIKTKEVVGMAGAFHQRKDYRTYLLAALETVRKREDVTFLAIGEGKLLDEMKRLVPPEFAGRILFTGNQSSVESIMNVMDIGVLVTDPDFHEEGISNAILEYMALSKPVIATRGGGTPELVIDHETGFLIEGKNVSSLVEKISFLLDHKNISKDMGSKGLQRVKDFFSIEKMVTSTLDLYEKISNQNAR